MNNFKAFTLKSDKGGLRDLKTSCGICRAFNPLTKGVVPPAVIPFTAIWDTGATGSVIDKSVVDKLDLKPISKTKVYHAKGEGTSNVYAVNIFLPNQVAFQFVKVTEGDLKGANVLIGMDIITTGDFSLTNVGGNTTFSFRVPSLKEIDYVQEHNVTIAKPLEEHNKSVSRKKEERDKFLKGKSRNKQ